MPFIMGYREVQILIATHTWVEKQFVCFNFEMLASACKQLWKLIVKYQTVKFYMFTYV